MINGHKLNGSSRIMLAALKIAIRNGVLVMQAMDDLDYKYKAAAHLDLAHSGAG